MLSDIHQLGLDFCWIITVCQMAFGMLADGLQELHDFAALIEVDPRLFHRNASYPHYDITVQMREDAIAQGAIPADRKKIIECAKKLKIELNDQTK